MTHQISPKVGASADLGANESSKTIFSVVESLSSRLPEDSVSCQTCQVHGVAAFGSFFFIGQRGDHGIYWADTTAIASYAVVIPTSTSRASGLMHGVPTTGGALANVLSYRRVGSMPKHFYESRARMGRA